MGGSCAAAAARHAMEASRRRRRPGGRSESIGTTPRPASGMTRLARRLRTPSPPRLVLHAGVRALCVGVFIAQVWGARGTLALRLTMFRLQWPYAGIGSFAHLKYAKCLTTPAELFDIAIIGAPFDTAVSYRPGELREEAVLAGARLRLRLRLAESQSLNRLVRQNESKHPSPPS